MLDVRTDESSCLLLLHRFFHHVLHVACVSDNKTEWVWI
jgi:hypothetical protein